MPGSLQVVNAQVGYQLNQFRNRLLEKDNGQRAKLQIDSSVFLDTIYVKGHDSIKNQKIVICSEGNAGFYEVGTISAPLKQGYSVFGWNRPGFGESGGECSMMNERKSIKAILEYVRGELKYKDEDIVVYGWSIGGYPSAVAANAVNADGKPIVNNLVLDATFDHVVPLIGSVLPQFAVPIGEKLVKHGWDLDVNQEVLNYRSDGKIVFFRRLRDEIISPGGPQRPDLNRINFLVLEHIKQKFAIKSDDDSRLAVIREKLLSGGRLSVATQSKIRALDGEDKEVWDYFRKVFEDLNQGHNDPMPVDRFRIE